MPAIIQVTAESNIATQSVNVWHARIPNVAPVTEANAFIAALDTFYTALTNLLTSSTWTIGSRVTTVDQSPNEILGTTSQTSPGVGAGTSTLAIAAVLHMSGGFVGPRYRGRKYIGPLVDSALNSDGRTITTSANNTITSAAATLLAGGGSNYDLVIWSRKFLTATDVASVGVTTVAGIQRRRLT